MKHTDVKKSFTVYLKIRFNEGILCFYLLSLVPLHWDLLRDISSLWYPVQNIQQKWLGFTVLIQLEDCGWSPVTPWRLNLRHPWWGSSSGRHDAGGWLDWLLEGRVKFSLSVFPPSLSKESQLVCLRVLLSIAFCRRERQVWTEEEKGCGRQSCVAGWSWGQGSSPTM